MGASGDVKPGDAAEPVARREFLRKAAVAGTGAFAVPMIVTVDPADAQELTSPPPEPPGPSRPESPGGDLVTSPGAGPPRPVRPRPTTRRVPGRSELPRTGADIDGMVAAGLTATAGGAALVLWSANMKSKSCAAPPPTDPQPET